jgi:UDP:flavonoid glycosyltransferase YjiC (YdhE family)
LEAPWLPGFRRLFGARATCALMNIGRAQSRRALRALTDFRRRVGVAVPPGDEIIDVPLQAERVFGLYSPHLGALPADAPAQARIAGFSFYDGAAGGATPLSLEAEEFFATGLPPVVFTLGSSGVHAPGRFYEDAVEAARSLRKRAFLLVGEDTAQAAHLAARDVCVVGYAPHSLVFPRAAAVVHHGGIGTVAQAMRAGRPQLVCPMLGDQADNAERLIRLGVAGRLDHKSFTAERAARALGWLTSGAGVAARAGAIATSVAAEDGAGIVADEILAMCAG